LCGSNKEKIIINEIKKGNQEGIIFETIHFRKDGSAMEVEINSHGSLLEGKQILLSIVRDITARKFAENALIKSENDYRTLVDNAPDIIARLDRSYQFVYFHNRSQIDLNVPTQLMIGKTFIDLGICNADYKKLKSVIQWVFENKHEKNTDFELSTATGIQYYNTIIVPELNKNGSVSTVLSISRSITETVLAQKAMAASLEKYRKLLDGIVTALSAVVEVRDPYTSGHQNRVSKLATTMAIQLNLDEDAVETVRITGLLHDIGKMYVPTELLVKPTKLSPLEYEIIKIHSEAGYNILKSVDFTGPIAEIVYQHHERMDGSGYPRKLKAGEILIEARIISSNPLGYQEKLVTEKSLLH
jgi:putative nucleotidyltransferase with HDIG domain